MPDRSLTSRKPWPLRGATPYEPKKKKMKAEWPTSVIEKSTNAFVPAKYQLDMAHPCEEINPALQDVKVDFIGEYKKMGCDGRSADDKEAVVGRQVPREQDRGLFSRGAAPAPVFVDTTPASPTPTWSLRYCRACRRLLDLLGVVGRL